LLGVSSNSAQPILDGCPVFDTDPTEAAVDKLGPLGPGTISFQEE
jgi:hypothetical protein